MSISITKSAIVLPLATILVHDWLAFGLYEIFCQDEKGGSISFMNRRNIRKKRT